MYYHIIDTATAEATFRGDFFAVGFVLAKNVKSQGCAKVLGYEPYVIATTGDHGFVMIDGLYYDNMGPLFGASTHFAYSVRSKVKF